MSAGRQSCVIVSQRSGRADPNPPEGQPVAKETIILPEYYMVRRGEPTTAEEYQIGTLQFKALHPGEGVPPRNRAGFVDVEEDTYNPDYLQAPPVVKPRIVRKRDTDLNTRTSADTYQPFVQMLIKDMSEDARTDILLQVAESLNMEIE